MAHDTIGSLSDSDLLIETGRAAAVERRSTAELIALLAEVDMRGLYLGCGYASLFVYCTRVLLFSEAAAYSRITAARASRAFPIVLKLLTSGTVTLTTISLLAAKLTEENHEALLAAASHKSRRDVERLVACLDPQPDVPSSVRRLPDKTIEPTAPSCLEADSMSIVAARPPIGSPPVRRTVVAALAADRYLLRVTLSGDSHTKLDRARALLRHQIPTGDPAAIIERALTALVEQLEKTKHAATRMPKPSASATSSSRHVPAAVKRQVWARDQGRCAFVGTDGRCDEKGLLEFHHVVPFAHGGSTDTANLQLRCRAHNAYEATLFEQSWDGPARHPSHRKKLTRPA